MTSEAGFEGVTVTSLVVSEIILDDVTSEAEFEGVTVTSLVVAKTGIITTTGCEIASIVTPEEADINFLCNGGRILLNQVFGCHNDFRLHHNGRTDDDNSHIYI